MFNRYHIRRALWGILLTGSMAWAGGPEYFGLTLNINSKDDVIKTLKARNTNFSSNYGYRGYGKDLPMIKIVNDPLLNNHGVIDEAWLKFTPDKKLYEIVVSWRDAGQTYTVIKDVFDEKYQHKKNTGRGFVKSHIYKHGDTKIILTRNAFGFGENQTTKVSYLHQPSVVDVNKMKAKIDDFIKRQNIKKQGVNL